MQESKVHYIDVGDMTPKQAEEALNKIRANFKKRKMLSQDYATPEDYKNELQFVFETQIAKLETALTQMRGAVDKSRSIPSEEVHQSLIRAYGELLKIGDMMGSVNCNLRWHNGDHSMYEGVDG